MSSLLVISRLTFREASRRKILLAALLLGLAFLAVYATGFYLINEEFERNVTRNAEFFQSQMANFLMMAGLYAVNFLTVVMTVLTSVDTISGEISSGTIQTLVSKPLRRWEVIGGKWLGYCGLISLYLVFMAGGVVLTAYTVTGYFPGGLAEGIALMWLSALLLLAISFLGGTVMSTLANGVLVFGLYGIAFVGGWIEQVGSFLQSDVAVNVGIVSSLIFPGEALWKRAAYEMQSAASGLAGGMTPFSAISVPSTAMIVYAVAYTLVILALAFRNFHQRDL